MDEFEEDNETLDEEENIYNKKQRENLVDDEEISAEEEAFMRGYEEAGDTLEEPTEE